MRSRFGDHINSIASPAEKNDGQRVRSLGVGSIGNEPLVLQHRHKKKSQSCQIHDDAIGPKFANPE
jgi:hypothetical protein